MNDLACAVNEALSCSALPSTAGVTFSLQVGRQKTGISIDSRYRLLVRHGGLQLLCLDCVSSEIAQCDRPTCSLMSSSWLRTASVTISSNTRRRCSTSEKCANKNVCTQLNSQTITVPNNNKPEAAHPCRCRIGRRTHIPEPWSAARIWVSWPTGPWRHARSARGWTSGSESTADASGSAASGAPQSRQIEMPAQRMQRRQSVSSSAVHYLMMP